jgi:Zn-dependent peptidase ImmA (M78 family)
MAPENDKQAGDEWAAGGQAVETEPLPTHWDDAAAALAGSFICARTVQPEEVGDLTGFSHACLRYAYMERRIQGDLLCELPAHLSVVQGGGHVGLAEEAEALAEAERQCLELPDGPIEDLAELLDDRGIKVFEWPQASRRELAGAFLMGEETGPALLSLAPAGSPDGRFILAHAYGHLVADIDPYENRFCPLASAGAGLGLGGRLAGEGEPEEDFDGISVPESRADLFARSLLVPRGHFARTLREFGQGGANGFSSERLCDVGYYYGVSPEVILCRLIDMEILTAAAAGALAARLPEARARQDRAGRPGDDAAGSPPGPLPRRFLNLSLALFITGRISKSQMGVLLGSGEAVVDSILAWIPPPPPRTPTARTGAQRGEGSTETGPPKPGRKSDGSRDRRGR